MLIMNEAGLYDAQGNSFTGADMAQIDRHIEGVYVDAWRRLAKVCPRTWLGNKSFKTDIGIIDTFTHTAVNNDTVGFYVDDTVFITNINGKKAIFNVDEIDADGSIVSASLISSESGFSIGSYAAIPLIVHPDAEILGDFWISVTAIKSINNDPIPLLTEGIGYVKLPSDFYLLTSFKMQGWRKTVREAALSNERTDNIQSNEYTRGSTIRPVCLIDNKDVNGIITPVLKYYSLPKGLATHVVEEAIYVPTVEPLTLKQDSDELNIDMRIIEPLAYLSASSVFTIFEKYEISKALDLKAESMMPGLLSIKGTNATVKQ